MNGSTGRFAVESSSPSPRSTFVSSDVKNRTTIQKRSSNAT